MMKGSPDAFNRTIINLFLFGKFYINHYRGRNNNLKNNDFNAKKIQI